MTDKERLASHPELYRAELSCKIGRQIISGEIQPPPGISRQDWMMYNLFHAVEDLARALMR